MSTILSSMVGGTPTLAIQAVDAQLPICGKPVDDRGGCTRKQGHYGPCDVAIPVQHA